MEHVFQNLALFVARVSARQVFVLNWLPWLRSKNDAVPLNHAKPAHQGYLFFEVNHEKLS